MYNHFYLCAFFQVESSEEPAVQVVLKSDTRRTFLLAEEQRLTALTQTSDDQAIQQQLNKVEVGLRTKKVER